MQALHTDHLANLSFSCVQAGEAQLDVQDGSFRQEPGSGVYGQVQGASVAVGNLDWVRSHSQSSTNSHASSSTPDSHNTNSGSSRLQSGDSHTGTSELKEPQHIRSSSSNGSSSSSSDSSISSSRSQRARAGLESSGVRGGSEQASTSGRPDVVDTGVMTVYVGVNGSLAGVFEIRDQLRPDAAATIRGLQQQGIDTILLSGRLATRTVLLFCHAFYYVVLLLWCAVEPT